MNPPQERTNSTLVGLSNKLKEKALWIFPLVINYLIIRCFKLKSYLKGLYLRKTRSRSTHAPQKASNGRRDVIFLPFFHWSPKLWFIHKLKNKKGEWITTFSNNMARIMDCWGNNISNLVGKPILKVQAKSTNLSQSISYPTGATILLLT